MRHAEYLRQRYKAILGYTGLLCLVASLVILCPLLLLVAFPRELPAAWAFLLPGLLLAAPGLLLWRALTPRPAVSLTWQEGTVIVVLSWLLGHPTPMRPIAVSKANTVAQIVLAAVVLADEAFDLKLKGPVSVLIWVTDGLTIASLVAYLRVWLRHMTLYESTGSKQ